MGTFSDYDFSCAAQTITEIQLKRAFVWDDDLSETTMEMAVRRLQDRAALSRDEAREMIAGYLLRQERHPAVADALMPLLS